MYHLSVYNQQKLSSMWKWKWLCDPMDYNSPWNSPGQNTGVGSLSIIQGFFPNQGSNPGLLHCGRILYQLSHKGSPRILEWEAYPFARASSLHRNLTGGLLHCRQILYQLSHKGSPRILEWVASPLSSRSSWPRDWPQVSCIAGRFFTVWATRKAILHMVMHICLSQSPSSSHPPLLFFGYW